MVNLERDVNLEERNGLGNGALNWREEPLCCGKTTGLANQDELYFFEDDQQLNKSTRRLVR